MSPTGRRGCEETSEDYDSELLASIKDVKVQSLNLPHLRWPRQPKGPHAGGPLTAFIDAVKTSALSHTRQIRRMKSAPGGPWWPHCIIETITQPLFVSLDTDCVHLRNLHPLWLCCTTQGWSRGHYSVKKRVPKANDQHVSSPESCVARSTDVGGALQNTIFSWNISLQQRNSCVLSGCRFQLIEDLSYEDVKRCYRGSVSPVSWCSAQCFLCIMHNNNNHLVHHQRACKSLWDCNSG